MEEGTRMSQKDMHRFHVLRNVLEGKASLSEAARALGVSYRHAKRLKKASGEGGLAGILHGNRGRAPANKTDPALGEKIVALSSEQYSGFNDSHFTEMLLEREGIAISRETVRRLRREAGIKPKQKRRQRKHHRRRPRKVAEGMMMLWDGSPHRWFGDGAEPCCLMAAMDDATGRILSLFFCDQESSWGYFKLLEAVVANYGIPGSVYQDRHSALVRNDDFMSLEEQFAGRQDPTQVGEALRAFGIKPLVALSPQAKGRVERLFATLQDRLVACLGLEKIKDMEKANAYLEEQFIHAFNGKFAVEPQDVVSLWRKTAQNLDLARVLSFRYEATVGNDNAIRFSGMTIDIPPGKGGRSYAGQRVELRQLLDGSWRVYCNDLVIAVAESTAIAEPIRAKRRRKGVPAAHDSFWVYMGSAPIEVTERVLMQGGVGNAPDGHSPASSAAGRLRRAGPGRTIGATRIA
jgi:transposase